MQNTGTIFPLAHRQAVSSSVEEKVALESQGMSCMGWGLQVNTERRLCILSAPSIEPISYLLQARDQRSDSKYLSMAKSHDIVSVTWVKSLICSGSTVPFFHVSVTWENKFCNAAALYMFRRIAQVIPHAQPCSQRSPIQRRKCRENCKNILNTSSIVNIQSTRKALLLHYAGWEWSGHITPATQLPSLDALDEPQHLLSPTQPSTHPPIHPPAPTHIHTHALTVLHGSLATTFENVNILIKIHCFHG